MKNVFAFLVAILAFESYAQTLYVPSSTNGIGASSIANSVGIGTASPRGQFDVAGTGDIFLAGNPNLGSAQSIYLPGHIYLSPYAGTDWTYLQARRFDNSGSTNLQFRTWNAGSLTDAAVITSIGRIGVGTYNPAAKLHVRDGQVMSSDLNYDNINIRVDGRAIPAINFTRFIGSGSIQHNAFVGQFYNNSAGNEYSFGIGTGYSASGDQTINTKALTVLLNGNVGVGITNPVSKLEVLGQSITGIRQNGTNNDFEALSVYNTTASNTPSGNGAVIQFYNNAANSNTNGSSTIYGASVKSVSSNNQYGWESDLILRTTKNNGYSSQTVLDALVVKGNSGNVGIGTTNPGSFKLAVEGKIWAKEVQVALSNPGPDYVFEPTYDLKPLAEIETYIKENKHLPEVPSAKEMEKNGVQLGEMNMLLLKKVEELTLHLIEQQKQIAELKKTNDLIVTKMRIQKQQ